MAQDFIVFNDVLRELQIEREELERMIQEGEVKAFREGDKIKFLRDDIEMLKTGKMNQPTIAVHTEKEGDALLIEEIVDEPEDGAAPEDGRPQPIWSNNDEEAEEAPASTVLDLPKKGKNESSQKEPTDQMDLLADFKENKSFLGVSEKPGSQPLLDIYQQHHKGKDKPKEKPAKYDHHGKADTEELVFEQESGDDLLETGELLFESKDRILPQDKEMEKLFSDSEMAVSPFDSREQELKDAWDLAEGSGEEIVTSAPVSPQKGLAIDQSKRRKKVGSIGAILAGFLAFGVLAFFIMFAGKSGEETVKIKLALVSENSVLRDRTVAGTIKTVKPISIPAPGSGKIQELAAVGTLVKNGSILAVISQNADVPQEIEALNEEIASQKLLQKNIAEQKEMLSNLPKSSKAMQEAKKKADASKKNEDKQAYQTLLQKYQKDLQKFQELVKLWEKEIPKNVLKDSIPRQFNALKALLAQKESQIAPKLESLHKQLVEKKTLTPKQIHVTASEAGIVKRWEVKADDEISAGGKIVCELALIQAEFMIAEADALEEWKETKALQLSYQGKTVPGIIAKVYPDREAQCIRLQATLTECEQEYKAGEPISLTYQKKYTGVLGVPQQAIIVEPKGNFVLVVKEDLKIYKREVRQEQSSENLVLVSGDLAKGDQVIYQIVYPKAKQMKDLQNGQSIVIHKD